MGCHRLRHRDNRKRGGELFSAPARQLVSNSPTQGSFDGPVLSVLTQDACRAFQHYERLPVKQLREALAPLVDDITRLAVGGASGVGRWSGV
jgi:hypothetical protein